MRKGFWILVYSITLIFVFCGVASSATLAVHPTNTRLFTGMDGKPLMLFGHEIFSEITDYMLASHGTMGPDYPNQDTFDLSWYITWAKARGMNYVRGWSTFTSAYDGVTRSAPLPYARVSGYGNASDGGLKFDLDTWDETFFTRLRETVATFQANGIYYSYMFFDPFDFIDGNFFNGNVFKASNNTDGITADTNGNGNGMEFFFSPSADLLDRQKEYVRKVIDTLYEFDNVIYEIANELGNSTWQPDMVAYIRSYEEQKGSKRHLIYIAPGGITNDTGGWSVMDRATMQTNNGDIYAYSRKWNTSFGINPPVVTSETSIVHPLIAELDHLDAAGDYGWLRDPIFPWRAFTRGYHFSTYDDPFNGSSNDFPEDATWEAIRKNIGLIATYASGAIDLAVLTPTTSTSVCSTGYCMYTAGSEYVFLQPSSKGKSFTASIVRGTYDYEWISISTGTIYSRGSFTQRSTGSRKFTPPVSEPMAIYIRKSN
jgi:hypothetical protein